MRHLLSLLFILFAVASHAQEHIALYEGPIPNNKPIPGLRDSAVLYPWHGDTMEFVIQVAAPDLTIFLPEKKNATGAAVIICPGGGYAGLAVRRLGK